MKKLYKILLPTLLFLAPLTVSAQSFRVQCPTSTLTHPTAANNNSEPAYAGPTTFTTGAGGFQVPTSSTVNGAIKCQQVSGGDGYATMADGTQTYMFSFGPLSGLADIAAGLPGTEPPNVFNTVYPGTLLPGDPATTDGASDTGTTYTPGVLGAFTYNGAVGLTPDIDCLAGNTAAASFTPVRPLRTPVGDRRMPVVRPSTVVRPGGAIRMLDADRARVVYRALPQVRRLEQSRR